MIEELIKSGANVNARSSGGITPLMGAVIMAGDQSMVEYLIKSGAGVNDRDIDGNSHYTL